MRAPKSKNSQRKAVRILSQYYNGVSRWTLSYFGLLKEEIVRSLGKEVRPEVGTVAADRIVGVSIGGGLEHVVCVYSAQGSKFHYAGVIFRTDLVYRHG